MTSSQAQMAVASELQGVDLQELESADSMKSESCSSSKVEFGAKDSLRKILPAAAGSFIEFYEFGIFAYMSSEITGNFYLGHGGSLATWASFAITFAFRPFGGFLFGWLADHYGRKPVMQATIVLMLMTTLLQGCLPTFHCCGESWGWFGLVMLLVLRVFQGLSVGGELGAAAVYLSEVSSPAKLGVNLSWISLTGVFGAWSVASMVVFFFESVLSEEQMLLWGWRLPYLSTIVPGLVIIAYRRFLEESPEFEALVKQRATVHVCSDEEQGSARKIDESPAKELLSKYKMAVLVGTLGCSIFGVASFVPPLYGIKFIQEEHGLAQNVVTLSQMLNYLIPALSAPAVGILIDRWGAGRTYGFAVILAGIIVPVPCLYWWAHVPEESAIATAFIGQILLGLCLALTTSVFVWLVELFPVQVRVTGVSVAYNIGVGVIGGMGPLVCDAGNRIIDPKSLLSSPAIYTLVFGIVSTLAVLGSRVLAKHKLIKITHIRANPY